MQALKEARERSGAKREWARRQLEADRAKRAWEERQEGLMAAVPHELWKRANATWGSQLLPWEIGAFGQLVTLSFRQFRGMRLNLK